MGLGPVAKAFARSQFAQCDPRHIRPDAILWDFTSHLYSGRGTVGDLVAFAISEINYFFSLASSGHCTFVIMIDDPSHVTELKAAERARRRAGAPSAPMTSMNNETSLPNGWQQNDDNRGMFASCLERAVEAVVVAEGGSLVSHCSSRAFEVKSGSPVRELEAPAVGEADVAAVHWARWVAQERNGRSICLRTIDTDSLAIGLLLQNQLKGTTKVFLWLAARGAPVTMGSAVSVAEGSSGVFDFSKTISRVDARRYAKAAALFGCDFIKKGDWARPRAIGEARAHLLFSEWVQNGAVVPADASLPGAKDVFEKATGVVTYWGAL